MKCNSGKYKLGYRKCTWINSDNCSINSNSFYQKRL